MESDAHGSSKQQHADAEIAERFEAAYDENGVDRLLIRENLRRTVTERVRAVEETLAALSTVRRIDAPR